MIIFYHHETGEIKQCGHFDIELNPPPADHEYMVADDTLTLMQVMRCTVDLKTHTLIQPTPGRTWEEIRRQRDNLLASTDYLAMPDYPISAEYRAAILAYRQDLRDLTSKYTDPNAVVWPPLPER